MVLSKRKMEPPINFGARVLGERAGATYGAKAP